MKNLFFATVMAAVCGLLFCGMAFSEETASFSGVLHLEDGSQIVCKLTAQELPFKSETLGEIKIKLKKIDKIEVRDEGTSIVISLLNGDTLSGKAAVETIEFVALFGKATVKLKHVLLIQALSVRRARENQGAAPQRLKQLVSHQSSLRQTDADSNGAKDYWTADICGFHYLTNVSGNLIKYIDADFARADAKPVIKKFKPKPCGGYFFQAMTTDQQGNKYRQNQDRDNLFYTNRSRFAFCAFPALYKQTGVDTFIVNEEGVVYKKDTHGQPVTKWPGDDPTRHGWEVAW